MKNAKHCIFIILTVIAVMILATACDDKGGDIHNNEPPEIIKTVITFDTDGGNSINRIEVTDMSLFSLPSNPTKTGYTFINWFMDADFETVATAENLSTITIGQNITLYAKWQINTYTVNFYDGETLLKTETVNYGESATPPTVTKEGHTFLGWDKEYSLVQENLNIYAKWGTNTYTVSFYDGETLLKTETVNYGESATAPTVTKEGFFITWSKEFSHVKEDLRVQAVFTIKHIKVTVYVDNEIYDEIYTTIEKDYKIEEPMKPEYNNTGNSNSDKYFHGWFTDENYTMSFNNDFQFFNDSAIYGKTIDVGSAIYNYSIAYDKVTITQFLDDSAKFAVIPSFINGFPVVAVGASAFANKTMLRTVIIGEGIQVIGDSTFYNCNGLTTITLPNSVTSIGDYAFSGCSGLRSVTIPNNVTSIGDFAFSSCNGLTTITLPNSVTSIGDYAFYSCSGLTSITIPDSVMIIGRNAFSDCSGITSIIIPNSVISIGDWAFSNCSGITSIMVEARNTKYHSAKNCLINTASKTLIVGCKSSLIPTDGSVTSIGMGAFYNCNGLTNITIPNSVTSIGDAAFSGCSGLTSITIPNSVMEIGNEAFSNCNSLTSIILPKNVRNIANSAFYGCSALTRINIPSNVIEIGNNAFANCSSLKSIIMPNSVISIGNSAFSSCSGLTSVTIPDSVTSIGDAAFSGCSGLTSVTIPDSVTSIGDAAFSGCSGLTSVTIPNYVTSIGDSAFSSCSRLKSVTIGNSVTRIGNSAFYSCSGLTSITIPDSVTRISNVAFGHCSNLMTVNWNAINCTTDGTSWATVFENCMSLTNVVFGDIVQTIPSYAFYNCSYLASVIIPNSVTHIGQKAFYNCNNIIKAHMPTIAIDYIPKNSLQTVVINGGTWIEHLAFQFCKSLTSLTLPESVTSIDNNAFDDCIRLTTIMVDANNSMYTSQDGILYNKAKTEFIYIPADLKGAVVIPNGVSSIGQNAFSGRGRLTSITIPDSVTSIGIGAFSSCNGLTTITLPNSMTSIGDWAFQFCRSLISINIYNGVISIGKSAFYGCSGLTSITIPNSVTSIGDSAFYGCTGLISITIPNSVTNVGYDVFNYCSENIIIYCEVSAKPYNWDENWNRRNNSSGGSDRYNVVWGWSGNQNVEISGYIINT